MAIDPDQGGLTPIPPDVPLLDCDAFPHALTDNEEWEAINAEAEGVAALLPLRHTHHRAVSTSQVLEVSDFARDFVRFVVKAALLSASPHYRRDRVLKCIREQGFAFLEHWRALQAVVLDSVLGSADKRLAFAVLGVYHDHFLAWASIAGKDLAAMREQERQHAEDIQRMTGTDGISLEDEFGSARADQGPFDFVN